MKKILLLISLTLSSEAILAQYAITGLSFDNLEIVQKIVFIDTVSNPDNSWQVGSPKKDHLSSARSLPNVIITDTINYYPVNDSSAFTFWHIADLGLTSPHTAYLSGYYKVDSDSIYDFGKIEYSPDNGNQWTNLLNDSNEQPPTWSTPIPVLSGASDWTYFGVAVAEMGFDIDQGDTVLFRFTFISDSIQNNRDGLMFDDLWFADFIEGISHNDANDFNSKVFPNPGTQRITIEFDNNLLQVVILDILDGTGKRVFRKGDLKQSNIDIDISAYSPGIYFYRIMNLESYQASHGKFIVK
ncbi:MAG: T9SS type A sorting domain-containing protein [Bacteroidota bacterium]